MADSPEFQNDPSPIDPAGNAAQQFFAPEKISFSASGSEYFGIWIVNILLSIVTLGIYSAWAKVRKTRYFYDNTQVAGSSFDYHGNPVAILKGRIIALVLVLGYQLAFRFSIALGFAIFILAIAVFPWLIWKSLQFKLYNSSYRGIRFGFRGNLEKVYVAYLVMPFAAMASLYLCVPLAHHQIKKFQHEESRFGSTHFSFHATIGSFYKIYTIGFLAMIGGIIAIVVMFGGTLAAVGSAGLKHAAPAVLMSFALFFLALYAWLFLLIPLFMTLTQNLVWNNTRLGGYRFHSAMKWSRMTFILVTNLLGIFLTLGLFTPFAQIRSMKYRLESISLTPNGSLDHFLAGAQQNTSALGEGVADLLSFDISL